MVHGEAKIVRDALISEMKGKLISIKIDCAKCLNRSIMAVNAQLMNKGVIQLKTVALKELISRATGEQLKRILMSTLEIFEIQPEQVYSITVDNGANMIKAIGLFMADLEQKTEDPFDITETIEQVIANESYKENLLQLIANWHVQDSSSLPVVVKAIRCWAHTLQLAAEEALRNKSIIGVIDRARSVSKHLRTTNIRLLLQKSGMKSPIINNATCWHSKYDMIAKLSELRHFCDGEDQNEQTEINLTLDDWISIQSIVDSLKPAKMATKIFQTEQMTPGI